MEFHSPTSMQQALELLASRDARCLAGGQSLVALMNLDLVAPARLVSLRKVAGLRGIEWRPDGGVRIGAMTTHAELADLAPDSPATTLLAQAA